MTNKIEIIAQDALKAVEWPFVHTAKFIALIDDAIRSEPPVKAAVIGLVQAAERAIGDTSIAAASKGIDTPEDVLAVTDVESFFTYFKNTFVPAVESAYKSLKSDLAPATAA